MILMIEIALTFFWKSVEKRLCITPWYRNYKRWNKYLVSLRSLVAFVIRLPISWIVSMACPFHDADGLIATGAKMFMEVISVYFVHFRSAAWFAAAPAITNCLSGESANVSGTVTSQASGLACDHGMSVTPSGRLPSVLDKPVGCLATGI